MFHYMLTFEFCECFLATILVLLSVFRCGSLCSLGYKFVTKVFELALYSYFSNVLLQLQTFLEIAFAFERVRAFSKNSSKPKIKFRKQVIIMLITAALVTLPNYLITKSIAAFGVLNGTNETLYRIVTRDFAQNNTWTIILFVILVLRTLVLSFVILIINLRAIFKYKAFMRNKLSLLNEQNSVVINENQRKLAEKIRKKVKKETRITRILLAMSLNYLIGNFPSNLTVIIFQQLGATSMIYNYYSITALMFTLLSHGMYTLLYLFLNSTYRNTLFQLFGRRKKNHSQSHCS